MYNVLLYIHSLLRYLILFFILAAIVKSVSGWMRSKPFTAGDKKVALFTLIFSHIQLIVGLILYFMSDVVKAGLADMGAAMKNKELRFWTVEHISMMVIAITLITVGYSKSKKASNDSEKHKRIAVFFILALVVIFIAIPWPWSSVVRGWMPGME